MHPAPLPWQPGGITCTPFRSGFPVAVGTANAEGTTTTAARSDHVHEGDGVGGSDLQVADEGSSLTTAATAINFAGAGVTATASGTAVTVTIPGGGGADSTGYTRTLTGTSSSLGTAVVTLDLSSTMEDGELIEILWRASAGGRVYGQSLISADAILDLTAQTTEPGTNSAAIQFKIGDTATGLSAFGHGSGFIWLIDTDSIYVANGRQRAMVAEVYELIPPAGGGTGPGSEQSDSSIQGGTRPLRCYRHRCAQRHMGIRQLRGYWRSQHWRVA